jgi:hypothetical protein
VTVATNAAMPTTITSINAINVQPMLLVISYFVWHANRIIDAQLTTAKIRTFTFKKEHHHLLIMSAINTVFVL